MLWLMEQDIAVLSLDQARRKGRMQLWARARADTIANSAAWRCDGVATHRFIAILARKHSTSGAQGSWALTLSLPSEHRRPTEDMVRSLPVSLRDPSRRFLVAAYVLCAPNLLPIIPWWGAYRPILVAFGRTNSFVALPGMQRASLLAWALYAAGTVLAAAVREPRSTCERRPRLVR
jgi:hypothetical protein